MLNATKARINQHFEELDDIFDKYDNSEPDDDDNPIFPQPWDDRRRR